MESRCGILCGQCKWKKTGVTNLPPQWNWIRYAVGGKMFAAGMDQ